MSRTAVNSLLFPEGEARSLSNVRYASILGDKEMARREFQNPSVLQRDGKGGPEWYIRYRVKVLRIVDGKPVVRRREKWETLGLCVVMTKHKAERKAAEIMREVNGQVYTIQSHIPFEEFVRLFREKHFPALAVPTQRTYDQWLRVYIEPAFIGRKLCDIKTPDIQAFLYALNVAPQTRSSIRGIISSIFKRAIAWGYLREQNPVALVELRKSRVGVREKTILTPAELQRLLLSVNDQVRIIILTVVFTGMRISECLGLTWKNVDLERGFIRVVKRQCRGDVDKPKSERGKRVLPMGDLVNEYVKLRAARGRPGVAPGSSDPEQDIFLREDGRQFIDCELLANYLTPIMRKLGLKKPGMGWHMFRRLLATWMNEEGSTDFDIADQLGHADVQTTRLYVLPASLQRREAIVRKLQARLDGTIQ